MNKYLEKIALTLPKSLSRYSVGGAKAGIKKNLKDLVSQAKGSDSTRLGSARKAAGNHLAREANAYRATKKHYSNFVEKHLNSKEHVTNRILHPEVFKKYKTDSDAMVSQAKHRADTAATRFNRAAKADALGRTGAQRVLLNSGLIGATAVGVGSALALKKKKDK